MQIIHILTRYLFKFFWIIPIKGNRIIFTAYNGSQFSCNPKYIFEELYAKEAYKFDFVWCLNDKHQLPKKYENVKIVSYKSIKYIYYQITAKYVIINHSNPFYIPLRRAQLKINTWHGGGAYKKAGLSVNSDRYNVKTYKIKYELEDTDLYISSSKKFTEVMSISNLLPKKIFFECGMPRNDIFFKKLPHINEKIKKVLNIDINYQLALYAPTYRGKQDSERFEMKLDVNGLLESLKNKFGGEWKLLLRTHINSLSSQNDFKDTVDVTSYHDMQELLYVSDVLISDYSSSIWDFSLTYKPAFLFVPDLQSYIESRGLYIPIEQWQYPHATSNHDLKKIISEFDANKNKVRIDTYLKLLGSCEMGVATTRICEKICSL